MGDIVIVSGLARSGTSLVAGMLHAMGVRMAETLRAPAPGGYFEFEDVELNEHLLLAVRDGKPLDAPFLGRWMDDRARAHASLRASFPTMSALWGAKSCPALLFVPQIASVAASRGLSIRWLVCTRPLTETLDSARAWGRVWATGKKAARKEKDALAFVRSMNVAIGKVALPSGATEIPFDDLMRRPGVVASILADDLGVHENPWAAQAMSLVNRFGKGVGNAAS